MYINCLELFKDDDKNKMKFVILLVARGTSLQMGETGVGRRKKYLLVMQGKTTGSFAETGKVCPDAKQGALALIQNCDSSSYSGDRKEQNSQ